jgi:hypothetical protein
MEPHGAEVESKAVAEHLMYLNEKAHIKVSDEVEAAADNYYGNKEMLHEFTMQLCSACHKVSDDIIYNGRDPKARKLADWWDNHQAGEARREKEDKEIAKKKKLRKQALKKLTKEERDALNI